jgi:hypothetical protein
MLAVVVDLSLLAGGLIDRTRAAVLFLCVELPLTGLVLWMTWRAVADERRRGGEARTVLTGIFGSGPVEAAESEIQSLRAVVLFVLGRRSPSGTRHITYGKGLLGTVATFFLVTVIEMVVLHLLIPVEWIRTALMVLGFYAFVIIIGLTLSRVVYPHYFEHGRLQLRQGTKRVLSVELCNIQGVSARSRINVVGLYPTLHEGRLYLPSQDGTNLDLTLGDSLRVSGGLRRRDRKRAAGDVLVRHLSLHVDDPNAAVSLIREERARVVPGEGTQGMPE